MEIGVNYGGHTAQPADDISRDGDLDYVVNLCNENDTLQTFLDPFFVGSLDADLKVIYVHSNSIYRHLIVFKESTNEIGWLDFITDGKEEFQGKDIYPFITLDSSKINKVVGIGNTIVILTPTATHYALWKSDKAGGYIYLGDHIPEIELSFGLQRDNTEISNSNASIKGAQGMYYSALWADNTDEHVTTNSTTIWAGINAVIAECKKRGYFINNFYVRYALQLYDGTITHHSAPIPMIVNSGSSFPFALLGQNYRLCVYAEKFNLVYRTLTDAPIYNDWRDIVKAVDIYVSPQISNLKVSDNIEKGTAYEPIPNEEIFLSQSPTESYRKPKAEYCLCTKGGLSADDFYMSTIGELIDNSDLLTQTEALNGGEPFIFHNTYGDANIIKKIKLPTYSAEHTYEQHVSQQFYLLKSIDVKDLAVTFKRVVIPDGYLTALEQPDRLMTNDNLSHDKFVAKNAYTYNDRLNLINISRVCFNGFNPEAAMPYVYPTNVQTRQLDAWVYINENGKDIVVKVPRSRPAGFSWYLSPYFYYPNPNAYKVVIRCLYDADKYYELPLRTHDTLNGAFYFEKFFEEAVSSDIVGGAKEAKFFPDYLTPLANFVEPTEELAEKWIDYPNKIYTSEVNNPFLFKVEGVNTINTAEILALTSTTKALSQGQFGQFPMYAFTTDGIWALETSSTGGISALHPVTRDVCTNIDSITQIDNAVLFHSARGIMLLQGSETMCISDIINTDSPFNLSSLPMLDAIPKGFAALNQPRFSFVDYLANSAMLYDYAHQRIILYQKSDDNLISEVSYVYSLKSKTWSMMQTDIKYTINAYPNAVVIAKDNDIFDYSRESSIHKTLAHQMLITRPLKLDAPFNLKTINTLIQRGNFAKGKVRTILYGSRDLINWHLVASSVDHTLRNFRGTAYKYFRIVALTDLDAGESLTGASILFDVRQNNQLR